VTYAQLSATAGTRAATTSTARQTIGAALPHRGYGHGVDEHGYPQATVDGFEIGMFVSYGDSGDAWVQAPDGSIGTLIWETGEPTYFKESIPPDPSGRWGTYAVQRPLPMTTDDEDCGVPTRPASGTAPRWQAWRQSAGRLVRCPLRFVL
jgi:hypothetical protein